MRLNYDTIERLAFWNLNYKDHGRNASAAVLIHRGGVEYPIMNTGEFVFSSDLDHDRDDTIRQPPSDQFWTELHEVLQYRNKQHVKQSDYESTVPSHEQHLIANIMTFREMDNLTYEFEWLIDQAEERYNE